MAEPDYLSTARAVYDTAAAGYAQTVGTVLGTVFEGPLDRSLLTAFVEILAAGAGQVADVGCGPGRIASFLSDHGLDVVGVDLSPVMVAVARDAHPTICFEVGGLTALPFPDGWFGGVVSWYSIIHTPPAHLDEAFVEFARVLAEDGHLLLAFQAGEGEAVCRPDAYGTGISLTSYRHSMGDVVRALRASGLTVHIRAVREPELDHESTPQAFVIARSVTSGAWARGT